MKDCPVCGDALVGRSDKKFCSDDCRSSYHNSIYRCQNAKIREINRALKRNRKILHDLDLSGRKHVTQLEMIQLGFLFGYHTHIELLEESVEILCCYDLGYRQDDLVKGRLVIYRLH